ncbi:MAG: hypothetical protein ACRCV7_06345 [Culicoidibacterales bacterium]
MKVRNKVLIVNAIVIFIFGMMMISFFPITQNIYINNEMSEIESHLKIEVENQTNVFEVVKFGSDAGYQVMTPKKIRGFEAFRPETIAYVVGYEKVSDTAYKIETSANHDIIIQVNEQTIDKFMKLIMKLLVVSFVLLLIIDAVAIYFLMKSIVQPLQKIEEKINQLVQFEFGKMLTVKGTDEFAILARRLNSLDLTLSQFIESRQSFATSLAHELKTPVAVIQSTIDLHQHKVAEYADYEYSKQIIEQNLARISETAKLSLQIFTRRTLFELQTHNVTEIVESCLTQWEAIFTKQQLAVKTRLSPLEWKIDEDSFMLILSTIFQNMSRYAKQGTTIEIIVGEMLTFKNVVSENVHSGTQLGLEIAKTLAEHLQLELSNRYEGEYYILEIQKQK